YTVSSDTFFTLIVLILYIAYFTVTFSVNNNMVTIEVLTGSNFKKWKEDIEFTMEMADVDLSLVTDKPGDLTVASTDDEKLVHAAWMKSNRICLLSMRRSILDHLKSGLPTDCTAKELMTAISERYRVSSNADIESLLQVLFNMKYDGNGGVIDYVIRMVDYQTKLKALKVDLPDTCIVHQALNTLPPEFSIIKTNYNSQDESWSINDLISRVVAEEEKLKKE
ncbi:UBN2 domain-containing protein, partial [Cephalotus follicularis]